VYKDALLSEFALGW